MAKRISAQAIFDYWPIIGEGPNKVSWHRPSSRRSTRICRRDFYSTCSIRSRKVCRNPPNSSRRCLSGDKPIVPIDVRLRARRAVPTQFALRWCHVDLNHRRVIPISSRSQRTFVLRACRAIPTRLALPLRHRARRQFGLPRQYSKERQTVVVKRQHSLRRNRTTRARRFALS